MIPFLHRKDGFTLMEILAVMLVVAVIASFLVPVIRSVRAEVYYQQAKGAAVKMAEAMRSYYKDSKGYLIDTDTSVTGTGTNPTSLSGFTSCPSNSPARTGYIITGTKVPRNVAELFACNYLSWKDFEGLPYTFTPAAQTNERSVLVSFTAADKKAGRYYNASSPLVFQVNHKMMVTDEDNL